jgi:hypothetical protein
MGYAQATRDGFGAEAGVREEERRLSHARLKRYIVSTSKAQPAGFLSFGQIHAIHKDGRSLSTAMGLHLFVSVLPLRSAAES